MSLFPLDRLLRRLVTHGRLTLIDSTGQRHEFGRPGALPSAAVRINDPHFVRRFLRRPGLVLGEAYMDGSYTIEEGTLGNFLEIVLASTHRREPRGLRVLAGNWIATLRRNGALRAAQNVQHHYDIDHRLYERFLDADMQYSCAYWRDGVTSLDEAQLDKKRHIAAKLALRPGMNVLDIGSGWGGLGIFLAREYGVEVTGVTLSVDQHETSVRRARESGLADRVRFKLQDYRDEAGPFDRIVSVGMFEHVGPRNFAEFFQHIDRLLKPDGVALLHTIGRMDPPAPNNAWMLKYIFPGSYVPSLSQLAPILEKRGLWLTDLETLRLHYAKTLAAWNERFQAQRSEIARMFDERFCRMWEFYLQVCEMSFRHRSLAVFQLQLAKQMDSVPITRDYIYREESPALAPESPLVVAETAKTAPASRRRATAGSTQPTEVGAKRPGRRSSRSAPADTRH